MDAVTDFPKYSLWVSGQKEVIDETPAGQTSPQVWKFKAGVPFDHPNANGETPMDMVRNNIKTKKLLKKWAKEAAKKDEV